MELKTPTLSTQNSICGPIFSAFPSYNFKIGYDHFHMLPHSSLMLIPATDTASLNNKYHKKIPQDT
jgi:hypothetical protein